MDQARYANVVHRPLGHSLSCEPFINYIVPTQFFLEHTQRWLLIRELNSGWLLRESDMILPLEIIDQLTPISDMLRVIFELLNSHLWLRLSRFFLNP